MKRLRFTHAAERRLIEIYRWTFEQFGEHQADEYETGLRVAFTLISDNTRIGRLCEPPLAPHRRLVHGSHVIYYLDETDGVLIVDVLHVRQDPLSTLKPDNG